MPSHPWKFLPKVSIESIAFVRPIHLHMPNISSRLNMYIKALELSQRFHQINGSYEQTKMD